MYVHALCCMFVFMRYWGLCVHEVFLTMHARAFYAFYAFYEWWDYFSQLGALAEGTSLPVSHKNDQALLWWIASRGRMQQREAASWQNARFHFRMAELIKPISTEQ
jgi:hypothetical protein